MRAWSWTAATPHARSRRIATRSCVSKNGDRVVFVVKSSLSPFLAVLLVFLAPHLAASSDGPASVHFKVGERLTYSLRWGIIAANRSGAPRPLSGPTGSEEHTSELPSPLHLVC